MKHLHHPLVGDLAQPYEAMGLPSGPGLRLNFCTPEPDSREREALGLLAGWASTGAVVPSRRDRSGNDRSGNDRSGNG
ncbi:MmyB family transcriptional regulator [Streptomyces spiralis]|uniref:MmyB family transcriptional regulator n=1 Tax=Streptomyces spiralis TaxID=66376 RepID=UPI001E391B3C